MLKYNTLLWLVVFITVIPVVFVLLRLYIRHWMPHDRVYIRKSYILSDVFMILALVLVVMCSNFYLWLRREASKHEHLPSNHPLLMEHLKFRGRVIAVQYSSTLLALYAIKASFLCLYHNISASLSKSLKRILFVTTVFTGMFYLINVICIIILCQPMSSFWSNGPDNCLLRTEWSQVVIFMVLHITTDIIVITTGYLVVRASGKMVGRIRIAASFIFLLGFCTLLCNFIFLPHLVHLTRRLAKNPEMGGKEKADYDEYMILCACGELNVALMATSLPAFRLGWRRFVGGRRRRGMYLGDVGGLGGGGGGDGLGGFEEFMYIDEYPAPPHARECATGRSDLVDTYQTATQRRVAPSAVSKC